MVKLVIESGEDLFDALQREASRSGRTVDAIVEQALREYLDHLSDAEPSARSDEEQSPRNSREFGSGAGTFIIPPDFDEPLEDLKDYQ